MKKRAMLVFLIVALTAVLAACGSKNDEGSGAANDNQEGKPVTIKIFQFKVEIAEALERLKEEYEKENPNVKLEIETVGGGADYGAALKAKFAAGEKPDIFNNGGYQELNTWIEHLEDLSDQPWVADTLDVAKEPMTKDGKIYGMPLGLEGYGLIYNKDLFAQAGITELPKTISELEEAAKKLKAAGITPFANGFGEWWVLGNHNFNIAIANQDDPRGYVESLNAGTGKIAGNPVFEQWADLLDLMLKYSNENPLTTDYNTQVTLFASGQAAMMQQGNWTQVQVDSINPDLNIGVLPMPISDNAEQSDKLPVGVPNNWVVNKNSPVKEEAKAFLNWMVTSDIGKKYMLEEFKFIPAFKSIEVTDPTILGDMANEIIAYSKDNKTLGWYWFLYPEGLPQELGSTMQAYIAGKLDRSGMFKAFETSWNNLRQK
ncbi:ABC transporter substrate-binding protein [Paenibacillus cisolokensis]|uniref:ABC transporter substrate-binding protein n=1 Tax=Paenibacillus cisolokensis TaxID=1658519 RepID=UPI003D28B1AE